MFLASHLCLEAEKHDDEDSPGGTWDEESVLTCGPGERLRSGPDFAG